MASHPFHQFAPADFEPTAITQTFESRRATYFRKNKRKWPPIDQLLLCLMIRLADQRPDAVTPFGQLAVELLWYYDLPLLDTDFVNVSAYQPQIQTAS